MTCHEDWLAVALGFVVLGLVLVGVRPDLPKFKWSTDAGTTPTTEATRPGNLSDVLSGPNLAAAASVGAAIFVLTAAGIALLGGSLGRYAAGYPILFAAAWLAQVVAGNATVSFWGFEYVLFAFAIGLGIGNLVPSWVKEAARTEFFIKTGLVILGADMVFGSILKAGALGIVQALLVVTAVWYACFWLSRRLKVDDEFAVMLSTAVSICGVSAAIAACGAIQGDKKKLTYVTSLVLVVAAPMMVLMPWAIKAFGIPDVVGGAWLGGTLDTTGSVTAAGEMVSEEAMRTGVIVKLSQNVLIGVVAFLLSVWWSVRGRTPEGTGRPSATVIWERFPKFVLGFVAASIVFSIWPPAAEVKNLLTGLRTQWFALAFVSIGMETRLGELLKMEGGRPALAFVGAQAFNVVWTLLLAYLIFGGILFPAP